ncbi:hypothetical protein DOY81_013939 [Sarcophaga bullata]|nr:hypothetical protein DOY81_013939 [Sarcophaga bullata]
MYILTFVCCYDFFCLADYLSVPAVQSLQPRAATTGSDYLMPLQPKLLANLEHKDNHATSENNKFDHAHNDKENQEQQQHQQQQHHLHQLHHGLRHRSNLRSMLNVPPTLSVVNTQMPPGGEISPELNRLYTNETELKGQRFNNLNGEHYTSGELKTSNKDHKFTAATTLPPQQQQQQHPPQTNTTDQHQYQQLHTLQPKVTLLDDGCTSDQCDECDNYQEDHHHRHKHQHLQQQPHDSDSENNLAFITNASTPALHEEELNAQGNEDSLFSFSIDLIAED